MKKNKKTKQRKDYLAPYVDKIKRSCWLLMLFTSLVNLFMLTIPLYYRQILSRVLTTGSIETLLLLTVAALCGVMAYGFFLAVRKALLSSISQWLQEDISSKLLAITVHKQSIGIPIPVSDGQRDLEKIKEFVSESVPILLDIPWAFIFLGVLYTINATVTTMIFVIVLVMVCIILANEKATRHLYVEAELCQDIVKVMADSAARSADSIEAMGMMPQVEARWQEYRERAVVARTQANKYMIIADSFMATIPLFLRIMILAVSSSIFFMGDGDIGSMIFFLILTGYITAPFRKIGTLYKGWAVTKLAYQKINDIFSAQEVIKRGSYELPEPLGVVSVEGLVYTPYKAPTPIIKGISFQLPAGSSMSIIGPSAAGKTTLGKLIIGLLAPTYGAVRLDGAETYQWERRNFGKYTGYMPQQTELFLGTIKDNVARMNKKASLESVVEACKMAECHEMIMRLPQGYDTMIERGSRVLSPGQVQRIGLARALYGRPKFVLLDEPNIHLDEEGEAALLRAIYNIKSAQISLLVVAHRPQVVASLDYMLVLKNGVIERLGATNDIMSLYRAKAAS